MVQWYRCAELPLVLVPASAALWCDPPLCAPQALLTRLQEYQRHFRNATKVQDNGKFCEAAQAVCTHHRPPAPPRAACLDEVWTFHIGDQLPSV